MHPISDYDLINIRQFSGHMFRVERSRQSPVLKSKEPVSPSPQVSSQGGGIITNNIVFFTPILTSPSRGKEQVILFSASFPSPVMGEGQGGESNQSPSSWPSP